MEDSGYLPRLATLVDRSLNAIGLNGSAIIPIILGFGCVTMATITTRILGSEREKTIATTILQFAIPCSAQIAVVAALLAGAGFGAMIIYSVTILVVFVAIGTILHHTLPGESSPLLIDLPPMRIPRFDNIMRKTTFRSYGFMKEATPWFFAGALVVGIMQITGLLVVWQNLLATACYRMASASPRSRDCIRDGISAARFWRCRFIRFSADTASSGSCSCYYYAIRTVRCIVNGDAERARCERSAHYLVQHVDWRFHHWRNCFTDFNLIDSMNSFSSTSSSVRSLDEELQLEVRICPQCRMEITSPFIARCPRCLAIVPTQETGCGSCIHRMSCPVIPSSAAKPL